MGRRKKALPVEFKTENNNKAKDLSMNLSQPDLVEVVETLAEAKSADKRTKFFMAYFFNLPMEVCANVSGLSPSYCSALVGKYRRNAKLRTHIDKIFEGWPQIYRNVCKMRLFKLQEAEGKAVEMYLDDPALLIDKPQLARQIKIASGAISDETVTPAQINIKEIKLLVSQSFKGLLPSEGGSEEDDNKE